MRKLLNRWSVQQETALGQMTKRKTARHRVAGFAKSERLDARFFLLALAPFVPVIVSDQLGWSRGALWHMWWWLSVIWAVVIIGIGFASYWRAFRSSLRKKR
ncbi:MAG: hypothetical protein WA948_12090 [Pontixanthobacter sp.]